MKRLLAYVLLFALGLRLPAAASGRVVAATPWGAALAQGAGASDVVSLAPSSMQDPRIYVPTAEDLARVAQADWVIYSGNEAFAPLIEEVVQDEQKLLRLAPGNTPDHVREASALLAQRLGTQTVQESWISGFEGVASRVQAAINAGYPQGTRVIVHEDLAPLATWLGFEVAAEFGPEGWSNERIPALAAQKPEVVIDSYHRPVGPVVAQESDALYVQFLIHPGLDETETLEDVLRYNQDRLVAYALPEREESGTNRALLLLLGVAGALIVLLVLAFLLLRRLARS